MSMAMLHGTGGKSATLITKSITLNGTYQASSDNADGYSEVTVNVPPTLFRQLVDKSITTVTADDLAGATQIGDRVFYQCALSVVSSFAFPNSITRIGVKAFQECRCFETLIIPDSVTLIDDDAFFAGFRGTNNIYIGSGIQEIRYRSFVGMINPTITITATIPPTLSATGIFGSASNVVAIYVPAESVTAYQTATNWTEYASKIQAIPN